MNIIEVRNLTKNFGTTKVLKGIDLTIYKGEVFGFVGHNGAGKSTFIHTITGIMNKSSGDFNFFGVSDKNLNQVKKRIGVMPDVSNLYEHMKGIQFLSYMGKLVKDKFNEKDLKILLDKVGLKDVGDKKIKSYSFGMKKKICIAQALLGNPDLIILDEPTSGLDPESAIKIRSLVTNLKEQGKTIFLTSHNLDEIDKISDRVGILSDGIIKKMDTPQKLKKGAEVGQTISIRTKPVLTKDILQKISNKMKIDLNFIDTKDDYTLLQVESDEDIPKLSKEITNSEFYLYEIKIEQRSLEDVFMDTKNDES